MLRNGEYNADKVRPMMRLLRLLLLLGGSAAPAPALQAQPSLAESCPKLTKEEIAGIENYKGQFAENALYARAYCVPVEEAERRMAIQLRDAVGSKTEPGPPPAPPQDSIGAVAQALGEKEAATFAGLWIQHQPRYRVVVAFTSNAAKTLAKYTRDALFEPLDRPGPTLAELTETQERLTRIFTERGFRWASAARMEQHGQVVFELAQEAAPIRAAATRGEFVLPTWVELKEPRPFPYPAPPSRRPDDERVKAFPQLKHRTDMQISTLVGVPPISATLELRNGCLVLTTATDSRVALWGAEVALDLSDPARASLLDRLSGVRISVGERVSLRGLQPGVEEARNKAEKVGESPGCPGPYRVVNGFEPQAAYDAQRRESRILALMNQHRLSRAAAQTRYAEERRRVPLLQALRTQLLAEHGDLIGGMWINEEEASAHLFLLPQGRLASLVPAELRPHVTSQTVPRSGRELETAKAALEAQLDAAGIQGSVQSEVIGGHLLVTGVADPRALSAAAVAGKVTFPAFARLQLQNAMLLGGYSGIGMEQLMQRYEQRPGFDRLRELVAATPVLGYPDPNNANMRPANKPTRAQSLDIAHWLVAYGIDDADLVAALQRAGADPIDAWVRQNGLSTPGNRAIIAEQVVVAEPVDIDMKDPAKDGYRSTVTWRVVETLKGSARVGDTLKQRLISGEDPDGNLSFGMDEPLLLPGFPDSLEKGSRWLLHFSPGLYRHHSLLVGGQGVARPEMFVSWQAPARISDGKVHASSDQQPVTLDVLRAKIAPVQRAFQHAGAYRSDARAGR
jgi:hypothetical protein